MIYRETFIVFMSMLCWSLEENFNCSRAGHEGATVTIAKDFAGHIPPRPNSSLTSTAKPDPFETEDPTTKAKLSLRRDLFSGENGQIKFYALLVAVEEYSVPPESGTWDEDKWPNIPNWKQWNTSYQVTPRWWDPFRNSNLSHVIYILGDDTCDSDKLYCNIPLMENTKYALKIRAFTDSGYQDTDIIRFKTLERLPVFKIVFMLAGFLTVTAIAVSLSIFNFGWIKRMKIISGRKVEEFSPVPEALSQKSFLKYTQKLLNTPGRLGNEFHLLGTLSSDVSTLCLHAQRIDNKHKNRYGNILPFDMTRVKLSIIEDDPSTDYINASFIKGYKQEVQYIAAQGPKEETCHDFYRMIIEQNIELIVMLTELIENDVEKCFKYYPEKDEVLRFKEIRVFCTKTEDLKVCVKRVLSITTPERSFLVTQLQFKNWRDFEIPENTDIMLKFCEITSKHLSRGCVLVHCSAGAGRTGTFIAVHVLLQELKSNSKISVFNTILKLRQQRINMVQTEGQLGYIYKCVSHAIEKSLARTKETSTFH